MEVWKNGKSGRSFHPFILPAFLHPPLWLLPVAAMLSCAGTAPAADAAEAQEPARAYLTAFRHHLDLAEEGLSNITRLADGAADQFIKNRSMTISMNEYGFYTELAGRAGGLTGINGWRGEPAAAEGNLILFALDSTPNDPDAAAKWLNVATEARGARVVLMANRRDLAAINHAVAQRPFQPSDFYGFVDNHAPEGEFTYRGPGGDATITGRAMLSSVINAVNGWLFAGELTAACTRRGEMPGFWLAFQVDEPRGLARTNLYAIDPDRSRVQRPFHSDFKVPPLAAGTVGTRYIAHLRSYLDRLEKWPDVNAAVRRITAAVRRGAKAYFYSVGHVFPHEVLPRMRQHPLKVMDAHYLELESAVLKQCQPGDVLLLMCMPAFEDETVASALDKGIEVIAMSSAQPPKAIQDDKNFHWIAAPWPLTDGCVEIPGYDVPILAVTGVMHGVTYYAVRSQVLYELALPASESTPGGQ